MKAIALIFAVYGMQSVAQTGIVSVGDLPGGFGTSAALGLSASGDVVTGLSSSSEGTLAFRWTSETGMDALPVLPGTAGYQGGVVSPSGNYITGTHGLPSLNAQIGFVWSEQSGMVSVGSLPGGRDMTFLSHITNSGLAVGKSDFAFTSTGVPLYRAITWTPQGGLEVLPLPEPTDLEFQSAAGRVLSDGRIFGSSNSGKWFYSEDSGFETLPVSSYMNTINSSGDFIIGTMLDSTSPIPHRARYWTPDTGEVPLTPYGDDYASRALFMNDDGSIIIGQGTQGWQVWLDQQEPVLMDFFLASQGVDMSGWQINLITAISADGSTIIGIGRHASWDSNRINEGLVITIPTPASAIPITFALFATRRKR